MLTRLRQASIAVAILFILGCVAFGCGGGGSSGGNTPPPGFVQVEAVFTATPSVIVDPRNIVIGDQITFELVRYDINGRTVLSGSTWATTDTTSAAGTLNASTGAFAATAATGGTTYTVSTVSGGTTHSAVYQVTVVQARLQGFILEQLTNLPINGVSVVFYDGSSNVVGRVTSASDGTFLASIPISAARFNLDPTTIPAASLYRQFNYFGIHSNGSGTSSGANTSTTLNDTTSNWVTNEATGHSVTITGGTGSGQTLFIASNTATQLTLTAPWGVTPDNTSAYSINTMSYSATITACSAPLPTGLTASVTTPLPTPIFLGSTSFPPPPPPNGCP